VVQANVGGRNSGLLSVNVAVTHMVDRHLGWVGGVNCCCSLYTVQPISLKAPN
jgi:hypothetical protein